MKVNSNIELQQLCLISKFFYLLGSSNKVEEGGGCHYIYFELISFYLQIDVPIHVHNGDTAIVTFTGVGFDRRVMGDTMPVTDQQDLTGVPGVQSVSVPGQVREAYIHKLPFFVYHICKKIYTYTV